MVNTEIRLIMFFAAKNGGPSTMVSLAPRVMNSLLLQEIKLVQGPADVQSQASFGTAMKYCSRMISFL